MCGIVGFKGKNKNSKIIIKKMADRIKHRGPDDEKYYIDDFVALGHRRLSIIDIESGSQPIFNEDKTLVLIYNGEIYNYQELKKELLEKGHKFNSNTDSEVLIHGFEEWKEDLPKYLRGMFSFAIWNTKEKSLFIARDHFGIKPLYYFYDGSNIAFASELKAFLEYSDLKKEFNEELLSKYLAFSFTPDEETFFKNVYKLKPGHYIIYKNNEITIKEYFNPTFKTKDESFQESIYKIEKQMTQSVSKHLISDVEVGTFLSSGVDSSYITSLAKPDKCYTIGYKNYNLDEVKEASNLAKKLNVKNKVKYLSKEEYLDSIETVIYYNDEPSGDPSIVALYHLAKLASNDLKVILSGEGSDEFFGGYNTYLDELSFRWYSKLPFKLRHLIAKILEHLSKFKGRDFLIRRGKKIEEYYTGVSKVFSDKEIDLCLKNAKTESIYEFTTTIFNKYSKKDDLIKKQALDINCWLVNDILHKADRMGMSNSLETRVPFVDKEVFKTASSLSYDKKISKNKTKIALREAAKKVIPTKAYEKKKLGFPVPVKEWIKEEDFYETIKKEFLNSKGVVYFNQKYILNLLSEHKKGTKNNYKKIWTIYAFLKWYDLYFEN